MPLIKQLLFLLGLVSGSFKMTEPSKVIHVRNVGHEISEVDIFSLCAFSYVDILFNSFLPI